MKIEERELLHDLLHRKTAEELLHVSNGAVKLAAGRHDYEKLDATMEALVSAAKLDVIMEIHDELLKLGIIEERGGVIAETKIPKKGEKKEAIH